MAVYLATIALEKNRWTTRQPSYAVSDFLPRLGSDGFDGIELWENHFLLADAQERRRLTDSCIPLIFNTYARFDEGLTPQLRAVADAICGLNTFAVKFNLEPSDTPISDQLDTLCRFAALLPDGVKLLSECHPGTLMEQPEDAKAILDQLPADRFGAILHLAPVKGGNARRFELYGDRIHHLHAHLLEPGTVHYLRLDSMPGVARDHLRALKSWGFTGTVSVEFTETLDTPEATYQNCVADLHFIKEALA